VLDIIGPSVAALVDSYDTALEAAGAAVQTGLRIKGPARMISADLNVILPRNPAGAFLRSLHCSGRFTPTRTPLQASWFWATAIVMALLAILDRYDQRWHNAHRGLTVWFIEDSFARFCQSHPCC